MLIIGGITCQGLFSGPTARRDPSLGHRPRNWELEGMEGCRPGTILGISLERDGSGLDPAGKVIIPLVELGIDVPATRRNWCGPDNCQ